MGDEDRRRELPHRVRGAARVGPALTSPPALSEELRQRIYEAVQAERAVAVEPDRESTTESTPGGAAPVPSDTDVTVPDGNHVGPAAEPKSSAEPGATAEPEPPPEPEALAESRPNGSALANHPADPRPNTTALANHPADPRPNTTALANHPAEPRPNAAALTNHTPVTVPPPRRSAPPRQKPTRRRFFTARTVMVAVTLIVAALIGSGLVRYLAKSPPVPPAPPAPSGLALHGQEVAAAAWIAQQVSHSAVVSCDPAMCGALAAAGFPGRNLRVVGPTAPYPAPYPLKSAMVVVTPTVQKFYGTSLASDWAPAVLAAFGSGDTLITVRVIAPNGAAVYRSALNSDLTNRKQIGNSLLGVRFITLSGTARAQLVAGRVDSRLMIAIADLAAKDSVDILEFGNIGPGGDADMPLRYADLAVNDPTAHLAGSAYVQSILTTVGTVAAPYRPARTTTVVLPGGQTVLRVEFTAPTPLGLSPQGSP